MNEWGRGKYHTLLTSKNDHVHSPKYTHDPANHHDSRQDLNESCSNVQPEDTAHVSVREVSPGSAQHCEGRHKCSCGKNSKNPMKAMVLKQQSWDVSLL